MERPGASYDFPQGQEVDPTDSMPVGRIRKNIWLPDQLVTDLEDLAREDDESLTAVIRRGLKHYVRHRKEGGK